VELPINPSKSLARLNPELFGHRVIYKGDPKLIEEIKRERDLHDQIEDYCRARGWFYVHSRMDRASTIAVGFPDFGIFMHGARTVFLECKRPGEKATIKQLEKIAHARKLGFVAEVVESMDGALEAIGRAAAGTDED